MSAASYANALLQDLGCDVAVGGVAGPHPAVAWAASGLMHVTGHADGPALMCPVPVTDAADGAVMALEAMAPSAGLTVVRGAALLGQRARLLGLRRAGAISPGGACHILRARNGAMAISLARDEDWNCVPAWLQQDMPATWQSVAASAAGQNVHDLVSRARELSLAAAQADAPPGSNAALWCDVLRLGEARAPRTKSPIVVDLSSLWAGPLCGTLLQRAGARVVKVESAARPDGARGGHGGFFDVLNGGKASVALNLRGTDGIAALRALLGRADIVIESARPRALRQMGIVAEAMIAERPGLTWVSISGHGRAAPQGDWVAFGDDAAVAGGFAQAMQTAHGDMMFCGDALADPLAGMHAAVGAWASWRQGGGRLVSLSLTGVAARALAAGGQADLAARARDWGDYARRHAAPALPMPQKLATARNLGADTRRVLAECNVAC